MITNYFSQTRALSCLERIQCLLCCDFLIFQFPHLKKFLDTFHFSTSLASTGIKSILSPSPKGIFPSSQHLGHPSSISLWTCTSRLPCTISCHLMCMNFISPLDCLLLEIKCNCTLCFIRNPVVTGTVICTE